MRNPWVGVLVAFLLILLTVVIFGIHWSYRVSPTAAILNTPQGRTAEPVEQDRASASRTARYTVPILMYHYISDPQTAPTALGAQLSVSPTAFEKQLQTLQQAGYKSINLVEFATHQIPEKGVILTFDDGYESHYLDAFPLLRKYGFTGTFFITKSFIGRPGYMKSWQIQEMREAGMEIGGHTVTHRNLANTPYDKAIDEISKSLQNRDPVFAYPSGKYSSETLDILSSLDVKAAVTTNLGIATDITNVFELPRIRVKEQTDLLKVIRQEIGLLSRPKSQSSASEVE